MVRVTNLNASTGTTYFRVQTCLCPVVEALPRSLDSDGSLKVCVVDMLEDGVFPKTKGTPMGEMHVEGHVRLAGANFGGSTFDTNFWTKTTQTGTGNATQANAQLTLATGATANSSIVVNSTRVARYVGGYGIYYRGVVRAPSATIITGSNTRRWGAFAATDGFFFEHNGSTLSVVCRKTSSDVNKVSSGSFNGNLGATCVLDTSAHVYEIYWTNSSTWFFIDNMFLHKTSGSTAPLADTMSPSIGMECTNAGGNTGANTLEVRSATINRLGQLATENIYRNITTATTTNCKYGPGRLHRIMMNSPSQQAGIVTVYDNTSALAPVIATMQWTANNAQLPQHIEFNCPFNTGLTVVTSQATNITIIYE